MPVEARDYCTFISVTTQTNTHSDTISYKLHIEFRTSDNSRLFIGYPSRISTGHRMNKFFQNTKFLKSITHHRDIPTNSIAEVAFAGRSNAGKSSAINALCYQKNLARTSKTPGRTQQINFFEFKDGQYLVDLPGYGFAKVPGGLRQQWGDFITQYFQNAHSLKGIVIVLDIRRGLTPLDRQLLDLCYSRRIKVHILLTKSDKLTRTQGQRALEQIAQEMNGIKTDNPTTIQLFSATQKKGIEQGQNLILSWLSQE